MKTLLTLLVLASAVFATAQNHDIKPSEALKKLAFMKGDWTGKQEFNTNGGPAMSGDATNHIDDAVAGHYVCEMLSTKMEGRKPTDTRHFISFDGVAGIYRAWWFTDTSMFPLEFEGNLTGNKLVLTTKPGTSQTIMRATYDSPSAGTLTYTLEMSRDGAWIRLFTTTYKKSG